MTMMDPNVGMMHMMNLPPVWRTPAGQSQSPAQYAQSQGRNWSQAVNDRNFMQGYYGNMQSGPDYSGGRYVPPTFAYGYGNNGQIDTSRMMWNEQRNYYTPEQNYRFPTMPNFGMMEGIGNYGMNPFQQMMQMQQMDWMRSGMGRPGAADLFRRGGGEYGIGPGEGSGQSVNLGQGFGNGVTNPFNRLTPTQYMEWLAGGLTDIFGGGSNFDVRFSPEDYANAPSYEEQIRRSQQMYNGFGRNLSHNYHPRMPMFNMGGMFSPYFGFGGLGGMLPGGGRFGMGSRPPVSAAPISQSGPPAPGGG